MRSISAAAPDLLTGVVVLAAGETLDIYFIDTKRAGDAARLASARRS